MSFWADEKTGRLDELCCLLFPHRAEAEFLSLAPTPRHLGQFPQELKDEGTVGTGWRRRGGGQRFTKWMREKKAQKVDWEARVEEKSEGKRARAWVKNPGGEFHSGRKGERAYQALLRLMRPPVASKSRLRPRGSASNTRHCSPNRVTAAMFLLLETERRRRPNWSQVRVFRSGHYWREGREEPGDGGRREEVGRRAWASRRSVRLYSNEDTEERLAGWTTTRGSREAEESGADDTSRLQPQTHLMRRQNGWFVFVILPFHLFEQFHFLFS